MRTPAIRDRLCGRKPGRTAAHRGKPFGQKTARRSPGHKSKPNSRLAAIIPYFPCFGEPGMAPGLAFFRSPGTALTYSEYSLSCRIDIFPSIPASPLLPANRLLSDQSTDHGSFSLRRNAGCFLKKSHKKELTTGHSGDMIQKEYSSFMYKFTAEGSRWKW